MGPCINLIRAGFRLIVAIKYPQMSIAGGDGTSGLEFFGMHVSTRGNIVFGLAVPP